MIPVPCLPGTDVQEISDSEEEWKGDGEGLPHDSGLKVPLPDELDSASEIADASEASGPDDDQKVLLPDQLFASEGSGSDDDQKVLLPHELFAVRDKSDGVCCKKGCTENEGVQCSQRAWLSGAFLFCFTFSSSNE